MSDVPVEGSPLRHLVVFRFKPEAPVEAIAQITSALCGLKDVIPGIRACEHGINNSPEQKNLGFTHAFLITFDNAHARDAYLPHPEHKRFGELLRLLDVVENVFVVDYEPAAGL